MKQITCELCGGNDLVKTDGVFVCQSCGTKYSVEEAKKMMVEGKVEVFGTVTVSKNAELENYFKLYIKRIEENLRFPEKKELDLLANKLLELDYKHSISSLNSVIMDCMDALCYADMFCQYYTDKKVSMIISQLVELDQTIMKEIDKSILLLVLRKIEIVAINDKGKKKNDFINRFIYEVIKTRSISRLGLSSDRILQFRNELKSTNLVNYRSSIFSDKYPFVDLEVHIDELIQYNK